MGKTTLFARYQPGGAFNVIDQSLTTGVVYFVDSGSAQAADTSPGGLNPDFPFATLDYAIGQCGLNNGDVIYLMPGHAENVATAGAILCDVAGLKIIGLGSGADTPTITSTNALGSVIVDCSTYIENVVFNSGIDLTASILYIDAEDVVIKDCVFIDGVDQAVDMILTNEDADRLTIDSCIFLQAVAAGPNSGIAIDGSDDVEIKNCYFRGNYAVGAIDFRTHASLRARVHDCTIWTTNAADIAIIDTITGSDGIIGPNLSIMLTDNAANITEACTGATFFYFDPIYVCNLVNEKGMLINKIASA